ncbi:MAG: Na+/H+ antiporter [Bryobacter sp.]|nr:Na+/H+ antiporter [Bryobacter sp.]
MSGIETILGFLLAALVITLFAKRSDQPYPIALVVGGLLLSRVEGFGHVELEPEVVFFLLLPPILMEAAFFTSWRDFMRWRRAILLLAFGLVTATSLVVALLCYWFLPGMPFAAGLALGAIVSPPDAAAATSITRGLKLPRRVVQILEGESLVNDASALTLYRLAVAAVVTGKLDGLGALASLPWVAVGGSVIGLALAWCYVKIYRWFRDPEVEILSSFLLSYAAYFLAEQVHASGVMAVVAAGLWLGWHSPEIFTAASRIRSFAVWKMAIFLINVVIFFLIGLQLPRVLAGLEGYPASELASWCVILILGVILVRIAWVFVGAYLPRWLSAKIRASEPEPEPRSVMVVAWTGLRGVVSLAAALALPLETSSGLPFPYRNFILFASFAIILGTLVLQGLSLRPLISWMRLPEDRSSEAEVLEAQIQVAERAMERLGQMEAEGHCTGSIFQRVKGYYEDRLTDLKERLEQETGEEHVALPGQFRSLDEQKIWWEMARVERETLIQMRRQHRIGDETLHEIERDIDLLESRITPQSA